MYNLSQNEKSRIKERVVTVEKREGRKNKKKEKIIQSAISNGFPKAWGSLTFLPALRVMPHLMNT